MSGVTAPSFWPAAEAAQVDAFLRDQFLIFPVEDRASLDRIRDCAALAAARHLDRPAPNDPQAFLDRIADHVAPARLNDLRLAVLDALNGQDWFRPAYYALARQALATLVGNELAMQRRIGLSVQLPGDDSSLLPLHCDVWDGDSPYELVLWTPFVDCFRTKSMCILKPEDNDRVYAGLHEFADKTADDLFNAVADQLIWLDVPYGHALLFSQNLLHGNRINLENATRWSMNCRFKSLFSPYADKRLGEFFEPITLRPATRLGLNYRFPEGFRE